MRDATLQSPMLLPLLPRLLPVASADALEVALGFVDELLSWLGKVVKGIGKAGWAGLAGGAGGTATGGVA